MEKSQNVGSKNAFMPNNFSHVLMTSSFSHILMTSSFGHDGFVMY